MANDSTRADRLVARRVRELAETLLANEPRLRIVLFGSRAAGTHDERSDFDLGIDAGRPLAALVMSQLRRAFDELDVLQRVDVVDLQSVDESFRQVACEHEEVLFER